MVRELVWARRRSGHRKSPPRARPRGRPRTPDACYSPRQSPHPLGVPRQSTIVQPILSIHPYERRAWVEGEDVGVLRPFGAGPPPVFTPCLCGYLVPSGPERVAAAGSSASAIDQVDPAGREALRVD